MQADSLRKFWSGNSARGRQGICLRRAGGNLGGELSGRILGAILSARDFELTLDEIIFARPFRRIRSHDFCVGQADRLLAGLRSAKSESAITDRRLTKTDDAEDDCCGDEGRDEYTPAKGCARERHNGLEC